MCRRASSGVFGRLPTAGGARAGFGGALAHTFCRCQLELHGTVWVTTLHAAQDASFTTHAMSAQALMQVFVDLHGTAPPPCTLLAIRGERFELGEPPSARAVENLKAATQWARTWLQPI